MHIQTHINGASVRNIPFYGLPFIFLVVSQNIRWLNIKSKGWVFFLLTFFLYAFAGDVSRSNWDFTQLNNFAVLKKGAFIELLSILFLYSLISMRNKINIIFLYFKIINCKIPCRAHFQQTAESLPTLCFWRQNEVVELRRLS